MRTKVPAAFKMSFRGPEGEYEIDFAPVDEWDGWIDVTIGGVAMEWAVNTANKDDDGRVSIGGMTTGSKEIWGDSYWFELRLDDDPIVINYWGDRVIWRTDPAV